MGTLPDWLDWAVLLTALGAALLFKPWLPLRHAPLQSPWMGAMVLLPCVWWTQHPYQPVKPMTARTRDMV